MSNDALGQRGESILYTTITSFHGSAPLFQPAFLGEKWPVADFVVELFDQAGWFALLQVKAIFCALLRRYEFELVDAPGSYTDIMPSLILRPSDSWADHI